MKIVLARVRGFCAGVRHALELTERLRAEQPERIVCLLHELVHNEQVTARLKTQGIRIVDTPEEAPSGAALVFSAHGVSDAVERRARSLPLEIRDATCPLVKQVQDRAAEHSTQGRVVLLAGKRGHREVEGILGRIPGESVLLENEADAAGFTPDPKKQYVCLSQTTFRQAELRAIQEVLRKRIPALIVPGGVCRATEQRQDAVRMLSAQCNLVLVAGSAKSSNTMRLCEEARATGKPAFLISGDSDPLPEELTKAECVGIASGASAPEEAVQSLLRRLLDYPDAVYAGEIG